MKKKTVAIKVSGLVQGVFFRKYTKSMAVALKLSGFVKNMKDGSVYIEASGNEEAIDQFIHWCSSGSPLSKVDKVDIKNIPGIDAADFEIR